MYFNVLCYIDKTCIYNIIKNNQKIYCIKSEITFLDNLCLYYLAYFLLCQLRQYFLWMYHGFRLSVRKHRSGNKKWTIQRNWQHRVHKTKNNTTRYCVGHHYAQTNTNNVNNTWTLTQTTGGKSYINNVWSDS